ncbi:hypothetical protein [Erwinia sp. 198]|uniref:hypothetical protein n=1 Tax=Erwinia sp. 198 TaxID=2022746 RepID=UPI000F66FB51|nr:hypothetical protein [Erwinia sp. 198]RRZ94431.1 hypothetical protein EGK14_05150 [Erwinia sp. 198]
MTAFRQQAQDTNRSQGKVRTGCYNGYNKQKEDMHIVRTDVAIVKASYATRANVSEAQQSIILWIVSAIFPVQLLPALIHYFSP